MGLGPTGQEFRGFRCSEYVLENRAGGIESTRAQQFGRNETTWSTGKAQPEENHKGIP